MTDARQDESDGLSENALLAWVRENVDECTGLVPLAVDASFKRHYRLKGCQQAIIAMYAPPPDSIARYVTMRDIVADAGVRAPKVAARDDSKGFALVEDLGDDLYDVTLAKQPSRRRELYQMAWETIDKLQANVPGDVSLPRFDEALLDRELGLFPQWYATKHRKAPLDDTEKEDYKKICALLKKCFHKQRQTYVHRDFHSRNLFATDPGPGVIDFSDAVIGPACYDIASLLRDLYVDLDEDEQMDYLVRHWEHSRKENLGLSDDFGEHYLIYEFTSLQRLTKILGLFVRLATRDGKEAFLGHLQKCETMAHAIALRYRELRPLALMIERRAS